jgi:hypothetical protein
MNHMDADDRSLLQRAASNPHRPTLADLPRPVLQQIAAAEGIDYATALLYDRLLRQETVRDTLATLFGAANEPRPRRDLLIGVAPGAFYQEYAFTGADGQRVLDAAQQAGVPAERVPLKSFGSLEDNARILGDWVARQDAPEICLVSLSKGGTDVQFALTEQNAAQRFRKVSTWINLSGIVQGTALANWLLGQWWRAQMIRIFAWWRRYSFEVVHEIKRDGNARLENAFAWPGHLRVFHVIGFPLRRHLSNPWAIRAHRRLESFGPSDGGGILLADAGRWPGTIIPLWGADHYLQDGRYDVPRLVMRLLFPAACGFAFESRRA